MKKSIKIIFTILIIILVIATTILLILRFDKDTPDTPTPEYLESCSQFINYDMCTMQHDPVCIKTESNNEIKWEDASNACVGCIKFKETAIGFKKGKC